MSFGPARAAHERYEGRHGCELDGAAGHDMLHPSGKPHRGARGVVPQLNDERPVWGEGRGGGGRPVGRGALLLAERRSGMPGHTTRVARAGGRSPEEVVRFRWPTSDAFVKWVQTADGR